MAHEVPTLPLEVWARVFQHLQPTPDVPKRSWYPIAVQAQTSFWQLPSVCKTFHAVFIAHPEFGQQVFLSKNMLTKPNADLVPSLVGWLQARAGVLKRFEAHSWSPDLATYLTALQHTHPALTTIAVKAKLLVEVWSLSGFTALTSCCLTSSQQFDYDCPDLKPLQRLRNLTSLELHQGHFSSLSAARHLTNLVLVGSCVANYWYPRTSCVSKLVRLRVDSSDLENFHPKGLLACVALQFLEIRGPCCIEAVEKADYYRVKGEQLHNWGNLFLFPTDFSTLVCLTHMRLYMHGNSSQLDFSGLSKLPNIHSLDLSASCSVRFDKDFETLSKLTTLSLSADHGSIVTVSSDLDWRAFPALQQLCISHTSVDVSSNLLDVAELVQLRSVSFVNALPVSLTSKNILEVVLRHLAENRPDTLLEPCSSTGGW